MIEHLDGFLSDFATLAILAGGATVRGIFDNGAISGGALGMIGATNPTFTAKSADLSGVSVSGAITVNGTVYSVAEIEPDGTGMTLLRLK